jgi:hypothetical protein
MSQVDPGDVFEEIADLLDESGISAEDAMKICSAVCIGICIDAKHPKSTFIRYMSDAWNHIALNHQEESSCH